MEPSESSFRTIRLSAIPSPVKCPLSCNSIIDVCGCLANADAPAKHPQTSIITWGRLRRPRRFFAVSAFLPCLRQGKNALTAQKTGRLGGNQAMRVEDILSGRTLVKVPVTLRSILQRNDGSIDGLGYLYLVIEYGHHQLAMVAHHLALTSGESKGLGPAQTNTNAKLANLRILIDSARITGDIQARNANSTRHTRDRHHIIQHCRRSFTRTSTMPPCLKAHTVDSRVHHRFTQDLSDLVRQVAALCKINGFAAKAASLCEPVRIHIADDNYSSA